jgi:hypothetical protein
LGSTSRFPPEFWTELSFKELGNAMGTFMDVDMSFRETGKMSMAIILVALDVREGLAEELVLIKEEVCFHQRLDYEGIPFRCHRCHKHGHNASQCALPFRPRNGVILLPPSKKRDTIGSKGPGSLLWSPWFGGFSPRGAPTRARGKITEMLWSFNKRLRREKELPQKRTLDAKPSPGDKGFLQDLTSHFGMLFPLLHL